MDVDNSLPNMEGKSQPLFVCLFILCRRKSGKYKDLLSGIYLLCFASDHKFCSLSLKATGKKIYLQHCSETEKQQHQGVREKRNKDVKDLLHGCCLPGQTYQHFTTLPRMIATWPVSAILIQPSPPSYHLLIHLGSTPTPDFLFKRLKVAFLLIIECFTFPAMHVSFKHL